jgi:hypothetical protein
MFRPFRIGVLITVLFLACFATTTPALASTAPHNALLPFSLPAVGNAPVVRVASDWTFFGCWHGSSTTPCLDVFRDPQGGLWICKACGTTGKPGPGKCRQTTQAELDRGLWCS